MKKKTLFDLLKIIISLGLGIFLVWWVFKNLTEEQRNDIWFAIKNANYWWLLLSMIIGLFSHYIRALRWNLLLGAVNKSPKPIDTYSAVAIGYIGNFVFPRLGEIVRCAVIKKTSNSAFPTIIGTVILERIFDMIVFIILFVIGVFFFMKQVKTLFYDEYIFFISKFSYSSKIIFILLIIFGIITLFIVFKTRKKLNRFMFFNKIFYYIDLFKTNLMMMLKIKKWGVFALYTLVIWVCYFLMTWVCFFSLEETKSIPVSASFLSIITGTIAVIIVQGGIGIFPLFIQKTLLLYGVSIVMGLALGWLIWLSQTLMLIILGIWAFIYLIFNKGISFYDIRKTPPENNII